MDIMCCEANENHVFNHNFIFANKAGDFPAGWKKYRGSKTAGFYWEKDDKQGFYINIKNHLSKFTASICQERSYSIPVCKKQVWEVGAILKVYRPSSATIRVHFFSNHSSSLQFTSLDFKLEPECDYYQGILTIPVGADYALLEIGTSRGVPLYIEDATFKRVFPIEKYNMDASGRLNIHNIESVTRIIEPVNAFGTFNLVRQNRDVVEVVTADVTEKASVIQDVFQLTTYSYCVINEGVTEAVIQMQLSPDGFNWVEDPISDDHIEPGQTKILVYNRFARYVRLKYWMNNGTTNLRIFFQGQG